MISSELFCFVGLVLQDGTGIPGIQYGDEVRLKLRDPPATASQTLMPVGLMIAFESPFNFFNSVYM